MTSVPTPGTPSADLNSGQQPQPRRRHPAPAVRPPLRRSNTDKMAGGVCGGLAEHTGIDSLVWRVGFVGLTLAGGAGVLVYLLLWVLMPPGTASARPAAQPARPGGRAGARQGLLDPLDATPQLIRSSDDPRHRAVGARSGRPAARPPRRTPGGRRALGDRARRRTPRR